MTTRTTPANLSADISPEVMSQLWNEVMSSLRHVGVSQEELDEYEGLGAHVDMLCRWFGPNLSAAIARVDRAARQHAA